MNYSNKDNIRRLQDTLAKIELGFSIIDESICWVENSGLIIWSNSAFDNLVSLNRLNILGNNFFEVIKKFLDKTESESIYEKTILSIKDSKNLDFKFIIKSNKNSWYNLKIQSFEDISIILIRDITKEEEKKQEIILKDKKIKQTNIEILSQKNYFNKIFDSTPNLIIIVDNNLTIKNINQRVTDILGYDKNSLLETNLNEILDIKYKIVNIEKSSKLLELSKDKDNYRKLMIDKNNNNVWVLFSITKLILDDREINYYICTAHDITKLKKLEEEATKHQSQLMHASRLSALGEMAASIAHEINQPLTVIKLNLHTLVSNSEKKYLSKEEYKEIVSANIDAVKRITDITNNMRNFARNNEENNLILITNINDAINNVVNLFASEFKTANILINLQTQDNLPLVKINENELEQSLINFINNSKYAVLKKKEKLLDNYQMQINLTTKLIETDNTILLCVEDNGIGMDQNTINRCLEPFYTTKPVGDGTGLGLSIVYKILKKANVILNIESKESIGTTIKLCFKDIISE